MNAFFAASLFDNPLVIAAIVIGSMIVNWMSQRRKAAEADEPPIEHRPPPAARKPAGDFDLQETIRQLLGEPTAPRQSTPPPIYPSAAKLPPPRLAEFSEETVPPISASRMSSASLAAYQASESADEPSKINLAHNPAQAQTGRRRIHPRTNQWRDRKHARNAFVSSLIFGPPKGLE